MNFKKFALASGTVIICAVLPCTYLSLQHKENTKVEENLTKTTNPIKENLTRINAEYLSLHDTIKVNEDVGIQIGNGFTLTKDKKENSTLIKADQEKTSYTVKKSSEKIGTLAITTRKIDNGDIFVFEEMNYKVKEEIKIPLKIVVKNSDNYTMFKMFENAEREHDKTFGEDKTTNVRGLLEFENDGQVSSNVYLSQNYISKELTNTYEDGETSRIRDLKEENQEYKVDKTDNGYEIENDMKLLPDGDHSESWFLTSKKSLIKDDKTKESYKNETNHYFIKSTKWQVSDGNYTKLPWSIEPFSRLGYGRNLVALQDDVAIKYYNDYKDRLFYDLVITSVNNLEIFKGKNNLWETEYTSTWLKKSYGIEAPYVDTRHNENIAQFLTEAGQALDIDEIKNSSLNYANYLIQQKNMGNVIETENGYYIADYFSKKAEKKTHVSLNHALGEANFLIETSMKEKDPKYKKTALNIYRAVQDSGDKWIKEDGDLWYLINNEGTYYSTDYKTLTLEDLTYSMTLQKQLGMSNKYPNFKKLMLSKLNFAMENGYEIPELTVKRLQALGYGDKLEGYKHILSF